MRDVIPSQQESVALAATPEWATEIRKYAVDAIGAFFLTFVVVVSVLSHSVFTPLAAGAALMVMIYVGSHIFGGHCNPAVTMGALVRGRIGIGEGVGYWIAQVVGGVIAGVIGRAVVTPPAVATLTLTGHTEAAAAVVELLVTLGLSYVMRNVAQHGPARQRPSGWRPDPAHVHRRPEQGQARLAQPGAVTAWLKRGNGPEPIKPQGSIYREGQA